MDQLQTRLNALEQQMHTLQQHTNTVTRRLRWWRGLACGLVGLAVLAWALPVSLAQDGDAQEQGQTGLAQRVAALEDLLKHFSREDNEVFLTGANLHLVNGLDATQTTNGLGNLIVGYNELRELIIEGENIRTGSHNVVVGQEHDFSRFGGLVVGIANTISGDFATVSGGQLNTASGNLSSVSGGGGSVIVGEDAEAVLGNTASGDFAVVSGGQLNTASGMGSTVSGGVGITQENEGGWAAGSFRSP